MFKIRANWLNSPKPSNASWAWRSSENGKDILKQEACKLVGSRESILVWVAPGYAQFHANPKGPN